MVTVSILIPNFNLAPGYSMVRKLQEANYKVYSTINPDESNYNVTSDKVKILGSIVLPKNDWLSGFVFEQFSEESTTYYLSILNLCKENRIQVVIPANDIDIYILSAYKDLFLINNIKVCCPDFKTFILNSDKLSGPENAKKHGILIPKTCLYKEALHKEILSDLKHGPLIVKASFSSSSNYVWKVDSAELFEATIRRLTLLERRPVIQEYIQGNEEYSCHFLTNATGKVVLGFTISKHRYLNPSWSTSVTIIENNDFYYSCITMIESYEQAGFWVVQAKKCANTGKFFFIEVNTRFGNNSRIIFEMFEGNLPAYFLTQHLNVPFEFAIPKIQKRNGIALIEDLLAFRSELKERGRLKDKIESVLKLLKLYIRFPALDVYTKSYFKDKNYVRNYWKRLIKN